MLVQRIVLGTLILGIALGVSMRLFQFGGVPVSLYWDEAAILVDAKTVSATGLDMHQKPWLQALFFSYGDYKLPVYLWLASVSSWVLGASAVSVRLPSLLAGLGTILLAGIISRQLWKIGGQRSSTFLPLAVGAVVALSPWAAHFSRVAFEGHLGQFLLGCSVAVLLQWHKNPMAVVASALIGSLAVYTYYSVRFVWPAVFVTVMVVLALQEMQSCWSSKHRTLIWSQVLESVQKYRRHALLLLLGLSVFATLLIPMSRSELYEASTTLRLSTNSVLQNQDEILLSNELRELSGNTLFDRAIFHRFTLTGRELLENYADNLSWEFLFLTGDPNLRHGSGTGLFLLTLLPFLLFGIRQLFFKHRAALVIVFVWWMAALLPASVPEETPHALRSLNALIPIACCIGFGLWSAIEWMLAQKKMALHLFAIGTVALCVVEFSFFAHDYFSVYPSESAAYWQSGYAPLADALLSSSEFPEVIVGGFDSRFFLWVLANPSMSPAQIHAALSTGPETTQILNVVFSTVTAGRLSTETTPVIVASSYLLVEELRRELGEQFEVREIIENELGEPSFAIGEYTPADSESQ